MLPSDPKLTGSTQRASFATAGLSGQPQISITGRSADADLTMQLLELELSLDGFSPDHQGFAAHVAAGVVAIGGELLFELPASGLIADCERIAVLRLPLAHEGDAATVFACLETDGSTIRIERSSEETAGLQSFAESFVDVLRRI